MVFGIGDMAEIRRYLQRFAYLTDWSDFWLVACLLI
jgi:hypothetical protein